MLSISRGKGQVAALERETMWISFKYLDPFAIKVRIGGINAVSGETASKSLATSVRQKLLLGKGNQLRTILSPVPMVSRG